MTEYEIDVLENDIIGKYPKVLEILLKDHTTQKNIFWATDNYSYLGEEFTFLEEITTKLITGKNGNVIQPRVRKHIDLQNARSKEMAEVFTPSWVCNAQNNLLDYAWFGQENVFNYEKNENGERFWEANHEKIIFPEVHNCNTKFMLASAPTPASSPTSLSIPIAISIGDRYDILL